jgi:dTMP kinase
VGKGEGQLTGRFITLEGGEGTGKSTQAKLLAEALTRSGVGAMATREPGGAPGAEAIRTLLLTGAADRWDGVAEALMMVAARRAHLVETIRPALERGQWVVCDRFADSTMAYQGYGKGVARDALDALHHLIAGDLKPDLTLIFDLPIEVGRNRVRARREADTRFEKLGPEFHERVRRGFLAIAAAEPVRCAVIDAAPPIEDIHRAVMRIVGERLNLKLRTP